MASNRERPLAGIRVIDSADENGELCGRLLADLGAEVIRVEPVDGAASRRMPPFHGDTSLYFAVRNIGKKSVTFDMQSVEGCRRFGAMLDAADVWIESHRASDLNRREILERHPARIITSITPFGLTGPYRDYAATDAVLVAMSGLLFRSGVPGKPPLLPPGALAYDIAGTTAAFATVAALWDRAKTGRGQHLDVSVLEAAAQTSDWALPNFSATKARGGQYFELRMGSAPVYTMYPCADGYVRLIILNPRQWRAMRAWLGEPQALQADHFDHLLGRMSIQTDILDPMFADFFKDKTKLALAREAQRRGLAMTPVLSPDEVLAADHFTERKTFRAAPAADGVNGRVADGFFILDGQRLGFTGRAPAVGEHDRETVAPVAKAAPAVNSAPSRYPFAGLRVLDFGIGGVGVEAGRLLAEYGADVIKIETRAHPDFIRAIFGSEMNPSFASSSRCKRGFGINLRTAAGLEIIKRLIAISDVVIENSATGTMERLGLGFDQMRKINPRLVLASSQLMGATGPWKDWIGFGPNSRTAGAMTWLWNFPEGGMPPGSGAIHPDHLAGRVLALGAVATLLARDRHGAGGHLEVAQVEVIIGLLADLMLKASLAPGSVSPQGNLSARGAPWGVYQCAGNERWCVITIRNDDEWRRFRTAIGDPEWTRSSEYQTARGRIDARAELDRRVTEWTSAHTDRDVTDILQRAGVPAGFMMYASDMPADPHLLARGYPQAVEQPGVGAMMFEGPAFHATSIPAPIVAPAPALGEHTREICRTLLAMSDADVSKLVAEGVLEEAKGTGN
ncbi:CoA transferase [Candidatus Binatus sp.]|uniref:CaiB/BaiF CoA-transferase family protein n=1 Tax=Candidatus Binatus sp. TaxID=2811406 RepID=UPI003CC6BADD